MVMASCLQIIASLFTHDVLASTRSTVDTGSYGWTEQLRDTMPSIATARVGWVHICALDPDVAVVLAQKRVCSGRFFGHARH